MLKIKKQISGLYISSVLGNLSLTGAWVAILSARGYSLVEIALAETVFHIISLLFELPSGILADILGRKKMLLVSTIMKIIGNMVMIASCNLFMVCTSIAFCALSYNFASGSGDALAYDSLKLVHKEEQYEGYVSNQMIIYRLCGGLSTLCAGFALFIGHRAAYGADVVMCVVQVIVLMSLQEVRVKHEDDKEAGDSSICKRAGDMAGEAVQCFIKSLAFLWGSKKAVGLMLGNSLVGAVDVLLLFFLQAKLPQTGMPQWGLGFALFFMEMGGIAGSRLIVRCPRVRYRIIFVISALLVLSGVFLEHSGNCMIMAFGGFAAACADDALQVRTNAKLQEYFPSQQRATLISMESFTFSMLMIILSPLAGSLFSKW